MSQTVIFSVGIVVFAITVWGGVLAGGLWFGQLADSQDARSGPGSIVNERCSDDVGGTPTATSQ